MKYFIGVDLGSTNIKAALYDEGMRLIARESESVAYIREGGFVEFDAEQYIENLLRLLSTMLRGSGVTRVDELALTGQAESLVVLDGAGKPLMNAISWMDERSTAECAYLAERFSPEKCARVTGQMAVLPTWPATKILWLKHNRPEIYKRAATYMLLKDYIVFRLCGKMCADCSVATFTFYFDIYEKRYWREMLDAIGVREEQLPPLVEPCTVAGELSEACAAALGIRSGTRVNVGTLDHFAGMIGTGNISPDGVTLSTGTVMALAAMSAEPAPRDSGIAMHYGFMPDTHVMLPVVESGGVSLEWFRRGFMGGVGYEEMNAVIAARGGNQLLFLPYIVGTNAPDFDADATGVFWGLRQEHDAYDLARAVMEGVAFVLRRNCDAIAAHGTRLREIIATGGGSRSPVWCQLQADATGLPVLVPEETEVACLGAAIVAAVSSGRFADYAEAASVCVTIARRYQPQGDANIERKYRRFLKLYAAALEVARI